MVLDILTPEQKRMLGSARDITFTHQNESRFYRASVFYDLGTIAATFAFESAPPPTVEALGLPSVFEKVATLQRGLILVTGASSSGKSSVVAALLDVVNRERGARIVTLQKRVEYRHTSRLSLFEQCEIGDVVTEQRTILRSLARGDADVIAVETLPDIQTMRAVLNLAQDRLVFAQIATVSAQTTVERFIESFPVEEQDAVRAQFAHVLKAVICCQLLPRADGTGRVGAYEILVCIPQIADLILHRKTAQIPTALESWGSIGMQTMEDAMLDLYHAGTVSRDVILARSPNRVDMEARLAG